MTEHALGGERPWSSLWALGFVPEKAGLEQYLQGGPDAERRRGHSAAKRGTMLDLWEGDSATSWLYVLEEVTWVCLSFLPCKAGIVALPSLGCCEG